MTTLVSIIIPCRNESDTIDEVVEQAVRQEGAGIAFGLEILVADGMSTDGTRQQLEKLNRRFSNVRIVDNPEMIVSSGLNRAIRSSTGDVIVRFDAHTEYASDYVLQCLSALDSVDAANVGGPALTKSRSFLQFAVALAYHSWFSVGGARFHQSDFEGFVDTVTYGCWRKSTLLEIGLFDEDFVRNQDDELNYRLSLHGLRIWQTPKIRSWYYPRASLSGLFRQYFQYGYWKVLVIRKHKMPASWRHIVPAVSVVVGIGLAVAAPFVDGVGLLLASCVGVYAILSLIASCAACSTMKNISVIPVLPFVFATYHIAYGFGFLIGISDFVGLRRAGRAGMARLSR